MTPSRFTAPTSLARTFQIEYVIDAQDFLHALGRTPQDDNEWGAFCFSVQSYLDSQIDWGIVMECGRDEMPGE